MLRLILLAFIPIAINAQVQQYGQCGGLSYTGPTQCSSGYFCYRQHAYYYQCLTSCPAGWECNDSSKTNPPIITSVNYVPQYGQCAGVGYTGSTQCAPGYNCFKQHDYYSQCLVSCPGGDWACAKITSSTRSTTSTTRSITTITRRTTTTTRRTTTTTRRTTTSTKPTTTTTRSTTTTTTRPISTQVLVQIYGQCGGISYSGPTQCASGVSCFKQHAYYSQCLTSCPISGWECSNGATIATSQQTKITSSTTKQFITGSTTTFKQSNSSCRFKFGTWFNGNSYDYSVVDYIGIWIGSYSPQFGNNFNIYWHGEMLKACLNYNKVPLYYGYIIAFLARQQWGLQDCDVGTPSLCQRGADFIRAKRSDIIATYLNFATETAQRIGTSRPTIWLIEPDFWQYYGDHTQQNGGLSGQQMRQLFDDIAITIRSQLPNSIISWDISAWIGESGMQTWWSFFASSPYIDFIHTSGGRSQANSIEIKPNELKWAFMSSLTGKKIIADTGYGVGGGSTGHNSDWDNVSNLQARIVDGVVAVSQGNARRDWGNILSSVKPQLTSVSQTKLCSF